MMYKTTVNFVGLFLCGLLAMGVPETAFAQADETVSGTVISAEDRETLPGVNVQIQGTSRGTVTDAEGNFEINVSSSQDTLVFSFVGYSTETVAIDGRTTIDVEMTSEAVMGEDIVVVGYGEQRQEAVTGSVASISGDDISEIPSGNITDALQGRMSGVDLSQTSTRPGATRQIRIRGTRSLTASNDPLIVLDGIPFSGSIGDINPNNIESVDILKDASSTAIYGSRGANGVIMVTTKDGQTGQGVTVSYDGYHGISDVFSKYPMMDGPEFVELREVAGNTALGPDESTDVNTDWQDLLYRNGAVSSHDFSISGGTEQGVYDLGVGYYQNEGVIPTNQYNRISLRGSIDQQVGDYFRFGLNTNNNYNITEGNNVGLGIISASPLLDPFNEDGSWKRTVSTTRNDIWTYSREVVNDVEDRWLNETRAYATNNALYGELEIPGVEGLSYRVNAGLDYRQSNQGAFTGRGINSTNPDNPSQASVTNSHTYHWVIENLLTYERTFAEDHNVNVTGLYSAERNKYHSSNMQADEIPNAAFQFYNLGRADGEIIIDPEDQDYQRSGLMSWMGRVMYTYDDRYMITGTLRSDGSSRLAEGHQWHTYPAVSLGWNIGNESFMDDNSFINMLKLRVGYGQTSNQAIAPYSTLGNLGTRPYNFGDDTYATGYYVDELPNENLGWEYSETWNFGLDFSVMNDRLSGTAEYYETHTNDILLGVNLPNTSGVSSYTANIGETQNKGVEFSLNGVIVDDPDGWTWEAGINVYSNRNELVSLASDQDRDEANWWFEGEPINVIFDYERTGLWQEDDEHQDILEPGGEPGMIKVEYTGEYDENGEPVRAIGPDDRQVRGVDPNFQGGFNTRLSYKRLYLNVVGAFRNGGILISNIHSRAGYLNTLDGRGNNVDVDYWTPENTDAKYPRPGGELRSNDNPKYGNTLGYFDSSYLKVRTMTLGYNFSGMSWLQNSGISRLRVYATAENPFVLFSPFNRETGLDPEPNSYSDQNVAVDSDFQSRLLTVGANAPATRNYMLGINLSF